MVPPLTHIRERNEKINVKNKIFKISFSLSQ